jgi:hypothetical protein
MSAAALRYRMTAALLLLIALLCTIIAIEYWVITPGSPEASTDTDATDFDIPTTADVHYNAPAKEDFVEILERPVFFPDRTMPLEPEPETVAAVQRQPLRLRLEGVAIAGDARVAVLRSTGNNQLLRLAEGTSYDGWLLESVTTDRAIFRRDADVTELFLDANGAK